MTLYIGQVEYFFPTSFSNLPCFHSATPLWMEDCFLGGSIISIFTLCLLAVTSLFHTSFLIILSLWIRTSNHCGCSLPNV
jgi:hypothetical protein